jgi:phage shock protein A
MNKEEQLIYLNGQLANYDNLISAQEDLKTNLNLAIVELQNNIISLENQKTQADVAIATYNANKVLVDQIIVIVEAS